VPEARVALERSLAIQQAKGPEDSREVAMRYDALGDIEHREGHPGIGHDLAQKALALKLRTLGPAHEELALTYRLDAGHLLALGRLAEARDAADRALAIDEKARGREHPETGSALITQGDAMAAQRQVREALAAYDRALQVLEKAHGSRHAGLCDPLSRLSAAALAIGDARRARELAERAVAVGAKAPPGDLDIAQVRLAQARWALGDDRPAALAQARQARAQLAALGFLVDELPGIDRWLASPR
jgi:tetratricopeptide (TPR) repeat protein